MVRGAERIGELETEGTRGKLLGACCGSWALGRWDSDGWEGTPTTLRRGHLDYKRIY